MTAQDKKVGIIDLGSNSVRLVIFEIRQSGSFRLIDDISETVRLSEGMIDGKYINDHAMKKAVKTIKLFKNLSSSYGISPKNIIAVATAAVRKAENKEQFLQLLHSATGLSFKLLEGEEEALYVYKAVIHTIDINEGIIVDIGGGSTEIIKFKDKGILNFVSLPIGAVVATEEFLEKDLIPAEKLQRLEHYVQESLLKLGWVTPDQNQAVIGLGGTIRNLAKIHRRLHTYPLDISHNYPIDIDSFYTIYHEVSTVGIEARKKIEGLSPKRADIIVGGLTILKMILSTTRANKLIVSGHGLREGLLIEYLSGNLPSEIAKKARFSDILSLSLDNYMDLFGVRREHAAHITNLALSMFDQLQGVHKLGSEERKILRAASLLHDIGVSISYYDHHRHSFYMILNSRLNGLTHRELVLVAAVAASHSKDKFKEDWEKLYKTLLMPGDMKMFRKLAMFLKIAECLDRSESGVVKSVECIVEKHSIKIKTFREDDAELELNLANENAENFKKIFNKSLHII